MNEASILVKFNKTDSCFQRVAIRDNNGELEYYHTQCFEWYELPAAWQAKANAALRNSLDSPAAAGGS